MKARAKRSGALSSAFIKVGPGYVSIHLRPLSVVEASQLSPAKKRGSFCWSFERRRGGRGFGQPPRRSPDRRVRGSLPQVSPRIRERVRRAFRLVEGRSVLPQ